MAVNDDILTAELRHLIGLWRLGGRISNDVVEQYDGVERAILSQMVAVGNPIDPLLVDVAMTRLRTELRRRYTEIERAITDAVIEAGEYEADFQRRLMDRETRRALDWEPIEEGSVARYLPGALIAGALLRDWLRGQESNALAWTRESLAESRTEGRTTGEAVDALLKALSPGRRDLEAVTRTAFGHTTAFARQSFLEQNGQHLSHFVWLSTLDLHTTKRFCLPRHEKLYTFPGYEPVGHDIAWGAGPGSIHFRCRALGMPVVKGHGELSFNDDGLPDETIFAFTGEIPRGTSANEWLLQQPRSFVEEIYGVDRADALLAGRVTVESLVREDNRLFTLDELRAFDALPD